MIIIMLLRYGMCILFFVVQFMVDRRHVSICRFGL
jgi:hypothetical protein